MPAISKIKLILGLCALWFLISLVLVGLFIADWLPKETFQWCFAGGFIAFAVLATILNNIEFPEENRDKRKNTDQ